jgi:hypothetical protein
MRYTHIDRAFADSNWDRIQALIDPIDGGLPQSIREYNQHFRTGSARRLEAPDAMLASPRFHP